MASNISYRPDFQMPKNSREDDLKFSTQLEKKGYQNQTIFTLSKDDHEHQDPDGENEPHIEFSEKQLLKEGYEERIQVLEDRLKSSFKENFALKRELEKLSTRGRIKEQADYARLVNLYKKNLQTVKEGSKNRFQELQKLLEIETRHNRQLEESRKRTLDHNQYLLKKMTKIYRVEDQLLLMTERVREGIENLHLGGNKQGVSGRPQNSEKQNKNIDSGKAKGGYTRRSSVSSGPNHSKQNSDFEFDTINANFIMNTPLREQTESKMPIGIPTGNTRKSARTPSPRNQKSLRSSSYENQKAVPLIQNFPGEEKPTLFKYNISSSKQALEKRGQTDSRLNQFNLNPDLSLSKAFNSNEAATKGYQSEAESGSKIEKKYYDSLSSNQEALRLVEEKQKQIHFVQETNSTFQERIKKLEEQNRLLLAQLKLS